MNRHWVTLVAGIVLVLNGATMLISGNGGTYWGFPVPLWTGWGFLSIGIMMGFLAIRAILRGEGKEEPKAYSEEEFAQAKAEMDAAYFKEHGQMPEKPKGDEDA